MPRASVPSFVSIASSSANSFTEPNVMQELGANIKVSIASSSANSFTDNGKMSTYQSRSSSLNRFFISEQFHSGRRPISAAPSGTVSIASSSANSFTDRYLSGWKSSDYASQSLLHQRTVSQS